MIPRASSKGTQTSEFSKNSEVGFAHTPLKAEKPPSTGATMPVAKAEAGETSRSGRDPPPDVVAGRDGAEGARHPGRVHRRSRCMVIDRNAMEFDNEKEARNKIISHHKQIVIEINRVGGRD